MQIFCCVAVGISVPAGSSFFFSENRDCRYSAFESFLGYEWGHRKGEGGS